jgi:hypothetical protein
MKPIKPVRQWATIDKRGRLLYLERARKFAVLHIYASPDRRVALVSGRGGAAEEGKRLSPKVDIAARIS